MPILNFTSYVYTIVNQLTADVSPLNPYSAYIEETAWFICKSHARFQTFLSNYHHCYCVFYLSNVEFVKTSPLFDFSNIYQPASIAMCSDFLWKVRDVAASNMKSDYVFIRLVYSFIYYNYRALTPIYYISQHLYSYIFLLTLGAFFFSYFNRKERNTGADLESTYINATAESEKELFPLEDLILVVLFFIIFFSSYFGFFIIIYGVESLDSAAWLCMPVLFLLFIIGIPFNLMLDFGVAFVMYLRGSANTPMFIYESLYDAIGLTAFFIRLLVQFIRVVIILGAFVMLHKAILHYFTPQKLFCFTNKEAWAEIYNMNFSKSKLYFLFLYTAGYIGYCLFEAVHSLFLFVVQFFAFCVIVFWLFLLFYSFFKSERTESFFLHRRRL